MDIPNHAELIERIEAFCRRHEMAETRFGRDAVNNPNLLGGLRRDPPVSPTLETLNRIQDFMTRVDADARLKEKLAAEPEPIGAGEDRELPFAKAPVNRTGASSATSSSTNAPLPSRKANGSCPSCSGADSGIAK